MTSLIAIDPGPHKSAYVVFDGSRLLRFGKVPNEELLAMLGDYSAVGLANCAPLVVEQIAAMGMAVGAEVFETVFWSGRFVASYPHDWDRIKRCEVKLHLCGNMRAKDPNIRQALIDRFGGDSVAIGKKKSPGPLYGVSGDVWAALSVAVTYWDLRREAA